MSSKHTSTIAILVFNNFLHDSRVLREAISLQKGGYEVKVIAWHEEGLPEFEHVEDIPVYRIKIKSRSWSKHHIIQIFKWLELFYRIVKNHRDADFYHVCDVLPLPVAMLIKRYFNRSAKVVYDAHELEFDKDVDRSVIGRIVTKLEKRYIHHVDARITVTDLMAKAYAEEYDIPPPKVVMNCPYHRTIISKDIFRKKFNIRIDQTIVIYQGLLKISRGIEELVNTFKAMKDDKYVLVLLGHGADPVLEKIKEWTDENENVFFHPGVHPSELLEYTASADIGTYLVQNTNRSHDLTIGNKIFEYIMCGLPVISSNLSGPKTIVDDNIGIVLENDEPENVKKAIDQIVNKGLENYKLFLKETANKYSWENQEKVLLEIYNNLNE